VRREFIVRSGTIDSSLPAGTHIHRRALAEAASHRRRTDRQTAHVFVIFVSRHQLTVTALGGPLRQYHYATGRGCLRERLTTRCTC